MKKILIVASALFCGCKNDLTVCDRLGEQRMYCLGKISYTSGDERKIYEEQIVRIDTMINRNCSCGK